MFTFKKESLEDFNPKKAKEFIGFWSSYYEETTRIANSDEVIHYLDELNIGHQLTEQNVKRILRWKDPHYLTEIRLSGKKKGKKNEKVEKVLKNRKAINKFRFGELNSSVFYEISKGIFSDGTVWTAFLFNIARPWEFPLADTNVFEAYKIHKRPMEGKEDWNFYMGYREYFFEVAINAGEIERQPTGKESNIEKIVENLKKVDNAILMFGKFLKQYGGLD
jgi:hypothetical protein